MKIWLAKDETAMMISKAGSAPAKWRKSCQAAIELPCGGGVDNEKLDRGLAPAQQGDECLGADVLGFIGLGRHSNSPQDERPLVVALELMTTTIDVFAAMLPGGGN